MKASIENLAKPAAQSIFDSPAFRAVIEDLLSWLITHPTTITLPVNAHQVDVYDFDWTGLLNDMQVPVDYHHITLRMNGGMSLTDIPQDLRTLLVPSASTIQNLVTFVSSSKKIK